MICTNGLSAGDNIGMTIGFDGSRAFVSGRTGTENYSYQLLKALAQIDQKNQYIVYLRSGGQTEKWPQNFHLKIINWPRLWTQGGLALQTFKDSLDVLFVPAHTLPLFRRPGLKTVVTVHDLGSEYLPSMHQVKQRLYLSLMQKYQLKTADRLIAVSKATKDDLVQRVGINPDKITVVYEGYDKNLFKPVKDDVLVNSLRQYGLKIGEYFLFVGTVQPRKNLERLIKAFVLHLRGAIQSDTYAHLGGVIKLVIAGQKGWLSDKIYKLPKQLGIEERVKFLGFVSEEDLPVLYSGALAFTFPSLFEGFGLPVLEAQACGCPVLTSSSSSLPEVAGKGAVYVDPYSIDDIVKGIERVKRKGVRGKLIEAGFENIKRFSWEKCAEETLEVLLSS
ncbi:glycosyltransferase family 4 protein [Candidatus Daviesbacteria bacterium]|nr:glycosyltransferase family 4 protein [Candidatus Daviesbacteria bacterium]